MSKRTIFNLFLLGIIVAVTMYVNRNPVEDNKIIGISNLTAEEIDTIVIQRAELAETILEKTDKGWLVTSPREGEVDQEKLDLLLKLLKLKSRHQHKITEQDQLERYDLVNPKISLFLNDQQFDFGKVNGFNNLRFVLIDGTVHSIKDITHHLLISDADSFIKK